MLSGRYYHSYWTHAERQVSNAIFNLSYSHTASKWQIQEWKPNLYPFWINHMNYSSHLEICGSKTRRRFIGGLGWFNKSLLSIYFSCWKHNKNIPQAIAWSLASTTLQSEKWISSLNCHRETFSFLQRGKALTQPKRMETVTCTAKSACQPARVRHWLHSWHLYLVLITVSQLGQRHKDTEKEAANKAQPPCASPICLSGMHQPEYSSTESFKGKATQQKSQGQILTHVRGAQHSCLF